MLKIKIVPGFVMIAKSKADLSAQNRKIKLEITERKKQKQEPISAETSFRQKGLAPH